MSNQTVVEFLVKKINELTGLTIAIDEPCIEEAHKMFEQQIIDAWIDGDARICKTESTPHAEQYYNKTFNK